MRKTYSIIGLSVFVLWTFNVSSAFATTLTLAEWLKNGAPITTSESSDTEGELAFENSLNKDAILCSGLFEGTVGPDGSDEVTKVFDLSGKEIKSLDESGATGGISCTGVKNCETGSEFWPVGLPFKTLLGLETEGSKLFDSEEKAAYAILCLLLGASVDELCEVTEGLGEVKNAASDVETSGSVEPAGACNGNAEDGLITVDTGLMALLSGTLSASAEVGRYDFGQVKLGTKATVTFHFINILNVDYESHRLNLETGPGEFDILKDTCQNKEIPERRSCEVEFEFKPVGGDNEKSKALFVLPFIELPRDTSDQWEEELEGEGVA